jgi:hypothetical protein
VLTCLVAAVPSRFKLSTTPSLSKTDSAFALALGGGIDAKVRSSVWVRLIQLDDLVTRFQSGTQNQPRISAGVVIRF